LTITAWRIYKPKHRASAFTGEGARRFGGRWNSKGVPLIYTSSSISLASLEMLVHLQAAEILKSRRTHSIHGC
jgi:RES domain-containing protein